MQVFESIREKATTTSFSTISFRAGILYISRIPPHLVRKPTQVLQ